MEAHDAVGLKNPERRAAHGRGFRSGYKKGSLRKTFEGQRYALRQPGAILGDKGEKYFLLPLSP